MLVLESQGRRLTLVVVGGGGMWNAGCLFLLLKANTTTHILICSATPSRKVLKSGSDKYKYPITFRDVNLLLSAGTYSGGEKAVPALVSHTL